VQDWLQVKVSVLPDVVRFICGSSGEEGVKRQVERFQASDTFGCGFGLDAALGHDTSVRTGKFDRSAHKVNRQVAFQGALSFLDGKSYLSADGRFQECGNVIAHSWRLMAGGRPYYVKHYNMRFIERQAFSLTFT
jgi:hypothetical protein